MESFSLISRYFLLKVTTKKRRNYRVDTTISAKIQVADNNNNNNNNNKHNTNNNNNSNNNDNNNNINPLYVTAKVLGLSNSKHLFLRY